MANHRLTETTPTIAYRDSVFLTPMILVKFEWGHPNGGAKYRRKC